MTVGWCLTHTLHHVPVGVVCDGVDVRRHLVPFLALVHLDDLLRVDRQHLVGIDDHAEQTRVRLWTERRSYAKSNIADLYSVIVDVMRMFEPQPLYLVHL